MATPAPVLVTCESETKAGPYIAGLLAAGIAADRLQLLTPAGPRADWEHLGARAAGLYLCGGPDVEPWRYGEAPLPGIELELDPPLDAIEFGVLAGARAARTPVWAICRGLQVLNVFLGGSLYQDLPRQLGDAVDHQRPHPKDEPCHELRPSALGASAAPWAEIASSRVNSRHHQGIKALAPGLAASMETADGLVEAANGCLDGWWLQGVQWHPEDLLALAAQRELFVHFSRRVAAGEDAAGRRRCGADVS